MGDRIAVFNQGRIEQLGAPMALYNRPANEFVAAFIGAPRINFIDRPATNASTEHLALWQLLTQAPGERAQRIGLRAEHLHLAPAGEGIAATVELAEHLGDTSVIYLRVAGMAELLTAKVANGAGSLHVGNVVGLAPDPAWALGFDAAGCLLG